MIIIFSLAAIPLTFSQHMSHGHCSLLAQVFSGNQCMVTKRRQDLARTRAFRIEMLRSRQLPVSVTPSLKASCNSSINISGPKSFKALLPRLKPITSTPSKLVPTVTPRKEVSLQSPSLSLPSVSANFLSLKGSNLFDTRAEKVKPFDMGDMTCALRPKVEYTTPVVE
ncbi:hypothetical protein B0J11DRAFT_507186 [Dendryphion nanum]|uniref:Uncharacterized protein n=1 Tax=Dendryphion nanum TaxID=256645 RepID=A0A9P9IKX5_9PLEO|nr:hypothetical protein B0J11DRAFT_507186 [Dendryphion nanum]